MLNNDDLITWKNDVHCTDRVDTEDVINTEVDADILLFTCGGAEFDCANFENDVVKEHGVGNAAFSNDSVDAYATKDMINHANNL